MDPLHYPNHHWNPIVLLLITSLPPRQKNHQNCSMTC